MTARNKDAKSQRDKFIEAARELSCDEDPKSFDRALKRTAEAPPPETAQERKKNKRKTK